MKNRLGLFASGIVLVTALVMAACTAEKSNQVRVSYIDPENSAYLHIYTQLKDKRHTLERDLLCMAYGADPELFEDVATWGGLPRERADICIEEFELVALAYNTLIGPHIDPELAKKVFDRSWLPEKTSSILHSRKLN